MKRVQPVVTFASLAGATLLAALCLWVSGGQAGEKSSAIGQSSGRKVTKRGSGATEPPMSIFDDKLRRFRFRLEHTDVVTVEEAQAFMVRYSKRGNPEIIGAYPDPDKNVLVVIGPPEAEQAIRKNLAVAIIETQGTPGGPGLKIKKRELLSRGRSLIADMAQIELLKVETAAAKDDSRDAKLKQLDARLLALKAELDVVEKQIQIVDKYLERLSLEPYGTAK